MQPFRLRPAVLIFFLIMVLVYIYVALSPAASRAEERNPGMTKKLESIQRSLTLQGTYVHNIGNLQMNITNWGIVGSMPGSRLPMSDSPSAQFPGGSGVEYLFAGGLWVSGVIDGVPCVSTAYPEMEFYPSTDPRDIIYRSREGDPNGVTFPGRADDDQDGQYDEDWRNGIDDDGDGLVDEDFAAKGHQMFSCWYTDDHPLLQSISPEHTPLGIHVRQETYQWGGDKLGNFIGVRYWITNVGRSYIESLTYGFYADVDAGPRSRGSYHMDDMVGIYRGIRCAQRGSGQIPVRISVAYVYDEDRDGGETPGYFGIVLINYPNPDRFYGRAYMWYFRIFKGLQPYEAGGLPINDYQRHALMSGYVHLDDNTQEPNDYKIFMGAGGGYLLGPGESASFDIAFVAGNNFEEMLDAAATAKITYHGVWADADGDPLTGIEGRQGKVWGPAEDAECDPCRDPEWRIDIPAKTFYWCNTDCRYEEWLYSYLDCYQDPNLGFKDFQTGVDGKEQQIFWIASAAPVAPNMRVVPGDHQVTLLWNNLSETVPDQVTRQYDFEGYQIWRADDWHRPLGTSVVTGPEKRLWHLLASRDLENECPPNNPFKMPFDSGGWEYEPLMHLVNREVLITMFTESIRYAPLDTVPCPPGLTGEECDTLTAIARHNLGFEGGRCYYKYVDKEAKNGLPYFYAAVAYDHRGGVGGVMEPGNYDSPSTNFAYVEARSDAQAAGLFDEKNVYVVPNPVTMGNVAPWYLQPNNDNPSGWKCEFRNLPKCRCTVRIFTVAGDLVQILHHDGSGGNGTLVWNLLTRNGQDVTSGVYLFSVDSEDSRFQRTIGKFTVIR